MDKDILSDLYINKKCSSKQIAIQYKCSEGKINYWIKKYNIQKRTISAAIYEKHNPNGDPFRVNDINTLQRAFLFGLGIGLYWGEGNKKNQYAVRLGNTDPDIILSFIKFLEEIYSIKKDKLRFSVQLFNNTDAKQALKFWFNKLKVLPSQFQKVVVTPSRGVGTYTNKVQHGVLTLYFNNKKLRNIICSEIENLKEI